MALSKYLARGATVLSAALLLGAAGGAGNVLAQQAPPVARIFGSVQINGANAPSGAVVTAYSGTTLCSLAGTGSYSGTQYFVDIDSGQAACRAPGTTLSFQVNGQKANETTTVPSVSSAVQLNLTVTGGGSGGGTGTITYQAGWNLVSGPGGTLFSQASTTLYTLTATSGGSYTTQPASQAVNSGQGYWAYFTAPTTVTLNGASQSSATVTAPAGQYIMIGNPSGTATVTVSGADVVYTYTPSGGYVQTTQLAPGQGAWAYSAAGATLSIR